jgi:hypothetical protein
MAAQVLCDAGVPVHLYDAMPSVGRKFLLAGKGGLNLTHSEEAQAFASRYGSRRPPVQDWLHDFDADALRAWALGLGIATFVGTSGRVFPTDMKAAPLLRAWLHRLRLQGVQFHMRHRWTGWASSTEGADASGHHTLSFDTPQGAAQVQARAVVLALGGGSWARLGSDGAWVPVLAAQGVKVAPLLPSNCGFDVAGGWSEHFANRFAGQPFKSVALRFTSREGTHFSRKGEFVATATGVEGSLVYAASGLLRDEIMSHGSATFHLDLLPDQSADRVLAEVRHPRGARSLSNHLKSRLHIDGIKAGILHEQLSKAEMNDPAQLAAVIKAVPITVTATRPLNEAISTAGGVVLEDMNRDLMLASCPGVFCAGEMLDWEAPTGGYLLQACFASGRRAGAGAVAFLNRDA